jgi:hypothetical protein
MRRLFPIEPKGNFVYSYNFIESVRVAVREATGATSVLSYIVTAAPLVSEQRCNRMKS